MRGGKRTTGCWTRHFLCSILHVCWTLFTALGRCVDSSSSFSMLTRTTIATNNFNDDALFYHLLFFMLFVFAVFFFLAGGVCQVPQHRGSHIHTFSLSAYPAVIEWPRVATVSSHQSEASGHFIYRLPNKKLLFYLFPRLFWGSFYAMFEAKEDGENKFK
jgi:hypothetical protein